MSEARRKTEPQPRRPWYVDGLRFECQPDCGACCTNHGDYSYVYLEGDDLQRLADLLGLSTDECAARYTVLDEGQRALRMDEPDCPFLDGARCTVCEARPLQCRTFPFWPESLRSRRSWSGLRSFCPGIDTGPLHSLPVIRGHLAKRKLGH